MLHGLKGPGPGPSLGHEAFDLSQAPRTIQKLNNGSILNKSFVVLWKFTQKGKFLNITGNTKRSTFQCVRAYIQANCNNAFRQAIVTRRILANFEDDLAESSSERVLFVSYYSWNMCVICQIYTPFITRRLCRRWFLRDYFYSPRYTLISDHLGESPPSNKLMWPIRSPPPGPGSMADSMLAWAC